LATRQVTSRWSMVSASRSQSKHASCASSPRRRRRSAVQTRLRQASYWKSFTRSGAQQPQRRSAPGNIVSCDALVHEEIGWLRAISSVRRPLPMASVVFMGSSCTCSRSVP
jgi:hypothetical protein